METRTITCVYCGHAYQAGTPAHGHEALTEHIKVCEKHPMRAAEATITTLRAALVGLVGGSTRQELDQLEIGMRMMPVADQDKAAALNAIHALQATVP